MKLHESQIALWQLDKTVLQNNWKVPISYLKTADCEHQTTHPILRSGGGACNRNTVFVM